MRVQRLDGQELDEEVVRGLSRPVVEALRVLGLNGFEMNNADEITTLIRSVYMWKYLRAFKSIYGMDLHLLKYTNLNTISSLLYVMTRVIIPYAHRKLKDKVAVEDWSSLSIYHVKRRLASLLEVAERVADAAGLANWLVFVAGGRYANLSERMLGLGVEGSGSVTNINLEFTQRQLVWSVMTVRIYSTRQGEVQC
ncbi:hypothetical protein E3P91_01364 [Wallemia ichthyophaga]|nr:hypothetical protein E3P91_01364 [Wallemia ichthyophaga]